MTGDWTIRRCDGCSKLESDSNVELIVKRQGEVDRVVHVAGGGMCRCGYLVEVTSAPIAELVADPPQGNCRLMMWHRFGRWPSAHDLDLVLDADDYSPFESLAGPCDP